MGVNNEELLKLMEVRQNSSQNIKSELRWIIEVQEIIFLLIQNLQKLIGVQCNVTLSYIKIIIIDLKKLLKQINHKKDKCLKDSKHVRLDISEELKVLIDSFQGLCNYYVATMPENSKTTNAQIYKAITFMKDALANIGICSMSFDEAINFQDNYFRKLDTELNFNDIDLDFVTEGGDRKLTVLTLPYYLLYNNQLLTKGKAKLNVPCNVRKRKKHNN